MHVRRPCSRPVAFAGGRPRCAGRGRLSEVRLRRPLPSRTKRPAPTADIWEAYFLKGAKVGYGHTTVSAVDQAGEKRVETQSLNHLQLERFGQSIAQDLQLDMVETPTGEVVSFTTDLTLGANPVKIKGHVAGGVLVITTTTAGGPQETRIPWSRDVRGFRGVEQSLEDKPLSPGEKRTLRVLVPLVNQVADIDLTAHDYERTALLDAEAELLRIEAPLG